MKKFEEDKSDSQEMKKNDQFQTNPEFMKKLQCLESSETSSKIEKIFMSDVKYKKLVALKTLKKVEESKDKGKYIKLRFHGKEKKVKFEEFMHVKNLDKQKLQATKDSMIQMMKRKIEFHKNQLEVYNMQILNKISIEREAELRDTIIDLQNEIRKKRKREKEEIEILYKIILVEIHKIYENVEKISFSDHCCMSGFLGGHFFAVCRRRREKRFRRRLFLLLSYRWFHSYP